MKLFSGAVSKHLVIAFSLFIYGKCFAEEYDWLGDLEPRSELSLAYGIYEDDASQYAILVQLPLFLQSELGLVISKYDGDFQGTPQKSDQYSMYFNSDPLRLFSYSLGYEETGKGSDIENKDARLSLQIQPHEHWSLGIGYSFGQTQFHYEELGESLGQQLQTLGLLDRDRKGYGFTAVYRANTWNLRLRATDYKYDELLFDGDRQAPLNQLLMQQSTEQAKFWLRTFYALLYERQISRGESQEDATVIVNEFFTRFEQEISDRAQVQAERRAAQKLRRNPVFYRHAYRQRNVLSEWDLGLDGLVYADAITYTLGAMIYEAYVETENVVQLYAGIDYELTRNTSVGGLISHTDASDEFYLEFLLGIRW